MSPSIGTRLGPYESVAPLCARGMGEVDRARDSKLGRDVALEVLPDACTPDRERPARSRRDAQVLAARNRGVA
jgi:eukaryotic-like serine/threonine-protein kinase